MGAGAKTIRAVGLLLTASVALSGCGADGTGSPPLAAADDSSSGPGAFLASDSPSPSPSISTSASTSVTTPSSPSQAGSSVGAPAPAWTSPAQPHLTRVWSTRPQHAYLWAMAVSPDGTTIATGDSSGVVKLWSSAGKPVATLPGRAKEVHSVAFSPDGRTLAAAGYDGTLRLWDVRTRQPTVVTVSASAVYAVAWSKDGTVIVTGAFDDAGVRLHSPDGKIVRKLGSESDVAGLGFSPDGSTLAVGGSNGFLELWNVADWSRTVSDPGDGAGVERFAFSPDGSTVYGASSDSVVHVWGSDGVAAQDIGPYNNYVSGVSVSPDGALLASGALDGTLRLTATAGQASLVDQGLYYGVDDLAFSPTQPLLLVAESHRLDGFRVG